MQIETDKEFLPQHMYVHTSVLLTERESCVQ